MKVSYPIRGQVSPSVNSQKSAWNDLTFEIVSTIFRTSSFNYASPNFSAKVSFILRANFSSELIFENVYQYYLQNFHYQSDGWLSARSATIYDYQVEVCYSVLQCVAVCCSGTIYHYQVEVSCGVLQWKCHQLAHCGTTLCSSILQNIADWCGV